MNKFAFIVIACVLQLCLSREYTAYPTYDWNSKDLLHVENKTVSEMKEICDKTSRCVGFNTKGWFKSSEGQLYSEGVVTLYLLSEIVVPSVTEPEMVLWPLPNNYTSRSLTRSIDVEGLSIEVEDENEDVQDAFERFKKLVYLRRDSKSESFDITKISVNIHNYNCPLKQNMDESYTLYVPDDGNTIVISSECVYGFYHSLQTLSQLIQFSPIAHKYMIKKTPWRITDEPFFSFRGMMIDTSRHFLPVPVIKSLINSMSFYKYNVLHWHITDEDSFPIEIDNYDTYPASFSIYERYTLEDARSIIDFARKRGIRVIPEIDVPGHSAIWCKIDATLCPSETCKTPLNPMKEHTFEFIENIITSLTTKVFDDVLFHVGGDEVNLDCWNQVPEIVEWMKSQNYTAKDAYGYFVRRVYDIVKKHNHEPVFWEEVYHNFDMPKDSIINVWLDKVNQTQAVVKSGYRAIFTHARQWYLPKLWARWDVFYNADFIYGLEDPDELKRVLGGEVCMWGEWVDTSDFEQTIWPRSVAASERLWTNPKLLDVNQAKHRLSYQRCLLNQRGIPASPLFADGRSSPVAPGSCMIQ